MTAIKAYFAKVRDMNNVFDVSLVDYTSADPNFWTSLYSSATYAMLLVNGDDADHTYISGLSKIYDADILDIRMDLQSVIDSSKFAKAIAAIPDLDISDFASVATTEDFINVIIQNLQPGACPLSFDNAPKSSGTFTDDFTGDDDELLEDRTGWTKSSDGFYKAIINSNQLELIGDSGTGPSVWTCTDQGNADQYVQAVDLLHISSEPDMFLTVRQVDADNFIGHHVAGTGSGGSRLCKMVSGSLTDSIVATQGAAGYSFKIECEGTTIRYFRDTGGGFSQVGTDQTITDHQTETSAGFITNDGNSSAKWDDFENGTVGASGSATVTGTAITGGVTESEIVTGGETIIITLTGDTWVATVGDDNAITDALIAGITSAQSETNGWNNVVRANMVFGDVARTSDTIVTITLAAEAAYSITANETITITIPATALTAAGEVVATPTFDVTNEGAFNPAWANSSNVLLQPGVAA